VKGGTKNFLGGRWSAGPARLRSGEEFAIIIRLLSEEGIRYREGTGRMYDQQSSEDTGIVIATSQAVNLTSTIASLSALAALFFCFADQRSRAIRRFSVQSVGLGVLHVAFALLVWILSTLLGWIPLVGQGLSILLVIVLCAVTLGVLVLRVRMMFSAYRG